MAQSRTTAQRGGAVVDRQLRFIELDAVFAAVAGDTVENLIGRTVAELFPALESPLRAAFSASRSNGPLPLISAAVNSRVVYLHPLRTSRGTIAAIELALEPLGAVLDVPSARTVINNLFAFVGVMLPDGTLIEANRAALQAAGLMPEDVIGKPFADTFWWSYDPAIQNRLQNAITLVAHGETVRYDVPVRLAENHFITIDFMLAPAKDPQGRVEYLIPSGIDVSDRTRIAQLLRDRERHLNLALDAALMGTWELDLRNDLVVRSPSTDRLFGFVPNDSRRTAKEYIDRVHPADVDRVNESIHLTITQNLEHRVEYRVIWPDGSVHWLDSRGELARDADGAPQRLIGALVDITARKAAEAALRESEARFRATFDNAPLGIAHLDMDGRCLRMNDQFCTITGYSRAELLNLTFQAITHPQDLAIDLALAQQLQAGEIDKYDLEKRYRRKDGGIVWVNLTVSLLRQSDGAPEYFIAIIEDISRRKADEAELRFQAQLLDAVGQGVIATDFDGTVRYWNQAAEQLYGWTRAEALGQNILDLVATDLSVQQDQEIMLQLRAGEHWAGQYFMRRRDGVIFPAYVINTPMYSPEGDVVGMVGVSSDISASLRMEAEREELLLRERTAREQADEALSLLDTLLTTAPIGFCFLGPDYRFLRINEALARMHGFPAARHLGRTVREMLPDLAPLIEPLFEQVLSSGQPRVDQEIVEERAPENGGLRIWRTSCYPVRLSDGRIVGLGIISNDITAYRAATDALRLSEERFRVALQNSPILVYTTDRDLRYTWIYNPHPAFAASRSIGRRDEELIAPQEAAQLTAVKQRVLDRGIGERREVQLWIDGAPYVYELTVEPLRDQDNAVVGLTAAAIDITDRRQTEAALRESEARYSALAEAVPAILFTNRPDGANDYISRNFYDFTGTERGSGEGYAWVELIHPDDRERIMAAWQQAVDTMTSFLIEYRFRRHDGVYRWFRVQSRPLFAGDGAVIKWFGVCLDIDDAKQVAVEREELLLRERAARAIAERTTARIAQLQAVTSALSEALTPAQVAEVIVKQSLAALGAASGSLRLISPDGRTLDALYSSLPADTLAVWDQVPLDSAMPICVVARSGQPMYFESVDSLQNDFPSLEPVMTALNYQAFAVVPLSIEGRTIGSLALTFAERRAFADEDRDVLFAMAGQAAQAIERARLYDAAQAAVEVRDTFIAIASHDLRSPLAALLGQAQLMQRRVEDSSPAQIARRAKLIADQTLRLNRMVGALLDLSRIQSNQLTIDVEPLDLATLLSHVAADIQPGLRQHTLAITRASEGLWVAGDAVRLEQVFHNLIGNAVKYSAGGAITVHLEVRENQVCVAVSDGGIGIPAEAVPHLFEQFYRVQNSGRSGMGIGLYTVREILNLHGGTITVESEEGRGSTFTVCLPQVTPP
ncbi:MAG: PAS domain S-box protein [Oscillochloris sp.]|nr:PAS domain S-box protein [Oscillochloris sp.]